MDNIYTQPHHSWVYPTSGQYAWVWRGMSQPSVAPIDAGGSDSRSSPQSVPPPHRGRKVDISA